MSLADEVAERAADAVIERGTQKDKPLIIAEPHELHRLMTVAREVGFDHLACLAAIDWPTEQIVKNDWLPAFVRGVSQEAPAEAAPDEGAEGEKAPKAVGGGSGEPRGRMEVVYNLYSYERKEHLAVQVWLERDLAKCKVASVADLWPGANWHEREAYDLYGVTFTGHPNLTRIFMPEGWKGHPGRRDYDLGKEQFIYRDGGEDLVTDDPGKGW